MWKRGKWLAICDVCGFEHYNTELKKRWDGLMVCKDDWEPRHPQDFVRPVKESVIPWSRPEPADVFVEPPYDTVLYPIGEELHSF